MITLLPTFPSCTFVLSSPLNDPYQRQRCTHEISIAIRPIITVAQSLHWTRSWSWSQQCLDSVGVISLRGNWTLSPHTRHKHESTTHRTEVIGSDGGLEGDIEVGGEMKRVRYIMHFLVDAPVRKWSNCFTVRYEKTLEIVSSMRSPILCIIVDSKLFW